MHLICAETDKNNNEIRSGKKVEGNTGEHDNDSIDRIGKFGNGIEATNKNNNPDISSNAGLTNKQQPSSKSINSMSVNNNVNTNNLENVESSEKQNDAVLKGGGPFQVSTQNKNNVSLF